jgi:hypothetical protein
MASFPRLRHERRNVLTSGRTPEFWSFGSFELEAPRRSVLRFFYSVVLIMACIQKPLKIQGLGHLTGVIG